MLLDFQSRRPPFKEEDELSIHTTLEDFDPSVQTPVFYGSMYEKIKVDDDTVRDFDPSISHPACVGYTFVDRPPASPPPPPTPLPNKNNCKCGNLYSSSYMYGNYKYFTGFTMTVTNMVVVSISTNAFLKL